MQITPLTLPSLLWAAFSLSAAIALVGPEQCFVAVQQRVPDLAIMRVGSRDLKAVNYAAFHIDSDVGLRAKVPVIALLCRIHLRVPRIGLVLGRGRRTHDPRIHQRARAQRDALISIMHINLNEDCHGHRLTVKQRFFGHGVAQRMPGLQEVNAQHVSSRISERPPLG